MKMSVKKTRKSPTFSIMFCASERDFENNFLKLLTARNHQTFLMKFWTCSINEIENGKIV